MRFRILLCALIVAFVEGHIIMSKISADDVPGNCIRPLPASQPEYPIADKNNPAGWNSNNMACGFLPEGDAAAPAKCTIDAGTTLTIKWKHNTISPDTDIIDPSHKGPCIAYMARSDSSHGQVWFKIWEDGYDATSKQWCVDKLIANVGVMEIPIPSDLASGNYLLRAEIIALHEAYIEGGAQPYVHCAELTVNSKGGNSIGPQATDMAVFPGSYKTTDPGISFDLYGTFSSYTVPGPALYQANAATNVQAGGSASSSSGSGSSSPAQNIACTKDSDCPSNICKISGVCQPASSGISAGGIAAVIFSLLFVAVVAAVVVGYFMLVRNRSGNAYNPFRKL